MILVKLWQYLRRDKLIRPLPTDFVTPYDAKDLSWDSALIFMTGRARDLGAVEKLKREYEVSSAEELIPLLPKRKKPALAERFLLWLQRIEGSYETDPYQHELNQLRKKLPQRRGLSETQMKWVYRKGDK